ncbi:MAG: polysaccharide deacetylase [Clostridia bacterium]|nr:polysaccharide deacetylase [Clostridia bacterium]
MQKKAFLIIFFFILAFFVGGLTGLAAAYFVTGSGTKAVPAQVQPTSESGPSFLEEASPSVQQEKNVLASGGEELISHPAPTIEVIEERNPDLEQKEEKEKKLAYLTIDDGPDPENTPAILEILRNYGIKATFFVIGTQVEKYPDLLEKICEEGHAVGNHTYNHVYKEIYANDEAFLESLRKNEEIIYGIIGERPIFVREPGGRFRTDAKKQEMVKEAGYLRVDWNIDSYDSRHPIPDAQTIFANVKRQAAKQKLWPAMVILFHENDGHETTVEALPLVIDYLLAEGFTFKSLEEMDEEMLDKLPKP